MQGVLTSDSALKISKVFTKVGVRHRMCVCHSAEVALTDTSAAHILLDSKAHPCKLEDSAKTPLTYFSFPASSALSSDYRGPSPGHRHD